MNMPKLRQIRPEFDAVGRLLRGYGANATSISKTLKCAPATAMKKLTEPTRFTIGDLDALSKKYGIPFDEIREALVK